MGLGCVEHKAYFMSFNNIRNLNLNCSRVIE